MYVPTVAGVGWGAIVPPLPTHPPLPAASYIELYVQLLNRVMSGRNLFLVGGI